MSIKMNKLREEIGKKLEKSYEVLEETNPFTHKYDIFELNGRIKALLEVNDMIKTMEGEI